MAEEKSIKPAIKKEQKSAKPKAATEKKPKEVIVRFSISSQIIYLVIAIIVTVVIVVYQITLKDEKQALSNQMELRGGALTQSFANTSHDIISGIFLDQGLQGDTKDSYNKLDFFELQESLNVSKMLKQEDVIYAYIINPFNQIIAHSDENLAALSKHVLPSGVKKYKVLYKKGNIVEPIFQKYIMEYKSPRTGKEIMGGIIDISFPLKLAQEIKSLKTYTGEVHLGMSEEGILATIKEAKGKLLNVAFLSILIGIGGAYLLALFISNPIKKMVVAMRKVATGDLNQSVRIRRKDEIGLLGWNFNNMTEGLREKEKIKDTFNKFVSAEVAEAVLREGTLKLGGEYKEVTTFFSDIRNFTPMSENMEPHEVIGMLNEYFSIMTDIIFEYKGVIDKYIGDEIMAVWGAPIKRENDVELCVRSAVAQLKALDILNDKRLARGDPEIRIGIGISTGTVISGKMGSEKRLDYTVIGDNVNLASRLCDSANKKGLHRFIVTESTYNAVRDIVVGKEVEPIYVRGKEKPIHIFEIHDIKEEYGEFKVA